MKEFEPIPLDEIPMGEATDVLFQLEEQIMKGNIPIELLLLVIDTAYNQTWGDDTIKQ